MSSDDDLARGELADPCYVPSSAETVVARVCFLSEIADTATRYVRALDAGDAATAASELVELRELCEERAEWGQDRE